MTALVARDCGRGDESAKQSQSFSVEPDNLSRVVYPARSRLAGDSGEIHDRKRAVHQQVAMKQGIEAHAGPQMFPRSLIPLEAVESAFGKSIEVKRPPSRRKP